MRLYGEILKKIRSEGSAGGEAAELFAGARCVLVFESGGYFEGVKTVREYTPTRVVLDLKKYALELEGECFTIEKYCDGDLELKGEICSLRRVEFSALLTPNGKKEVERERV
ncbi:MAG: YabP/YqfC family sporulation protein [Clostridia bacterium]|nr:YabP/YqfC family sporulation protein [Clostridia bacterium]